MPSERTFLIDYVTRYLAGVPSLPEVLSICLSASARSSKPAAAKRQTLARPLGPRLTSGIIPVAGGEHGTTYHKMGEDAIDRAASPRPPLLSFPKPRT